MYFCFVFTDFTGCNRKTKEQYTKSARNRLVVEDTYLSSIECSAQRHYLTALPINNYVIQNSSTTANIEGIAGLTYAV